MKQNIEHFLDEVKRYDTSLTSTYAILGDEANKIKTLREKILPPESIITSMPNEQTLNRSEDIDNKFLVSINGFDTSNISINDDGTLNYDGKVITTMPLLYLNTDAIAQKAENNVRNWLLPFLPDWIHEYDHFVEYALSEVPTQVPLAIVSRELAKEGVNPENILNLNVPTEVSEKAKNLMGTYVTLFQITEMSSIPLDNIVLEKMGLRTKELGTEVTDDPYFQSIIILPEQRYISYLRNPLGIQTKHTFMDTFFKDSQKLKVEKVKYDTSTSKQ